MCFVPQEYLLLLRLNGKSYKTVARPAVMFYGSKRESLTVDKNIGQRSKSKENENVEADARAVVRKKGGNASITLSPSYCRRNERSSWLWLCCAQR